ncbi:MAG: hypothetical protein ACRDHP_02445, partial [Ktedonobacterales bacterium]
YQVGRNLQVINAAADEEFWSIPFRLGNPEAVPAPILLHAGGNDRAALDAVVRIRGRIVPLDAPIWLDAHEQVEAALVLRARVDSPLAHLRTLEATIRGAFIDGIEVTVHRLAYVARDTGVIVPTRDLAREDVYAAVH